ncbi:MAG: hypothetical protein C0467_22685 [Planctomycetaceae bacterium]|nr:hypothetical protein [Planctomycetaceae bacterium]
MRTPPGFPPEITPAFDALRDDMMMLAWKMTLYQNAYLNQDNRALLFERTATVFCLFEDSLSTDLTISIARLMDPPVSGKNKPNLTLRYLFELIREYGNAPTLLDAVQARYAKLDAILKHIGELRNKVLAHRDRSTALTTPLQLPLTTQNIIDVCAEFKGIINDIDGYFAESTTLFDFQVSYSNLDNLICHLRRGIQGMNEDNEREMQRYLPKPSESA